MAEGHDGFECLIGCKYLIDDEQGQIMSTLVRRYLLGWSLHPIVQLSYGVFDLFRTLCRCHLHKKDVPPHRQESCTSAY